MKKLMNFSALAIMAMTLVFTSCSKDDEKQPTHPASIAGTWSYASASSGYSCDLIIGEALTETGAYTRLSIVRPGEDNKDFMVGGTIYDASTGTAKMTFDKIPGGVNGKIIVRSETELTIEITTASPEQPISLNLKKVPFPLSINGTWAGKATNDQTLNVLFDIHPSLVGGKLEGEMTVGESSYEIDKITYDAKTGKVTFEYKIGTENVKGTMQYDYKSDTLKGAFDANADNDVDDFELEQLATAV